MVRDGVAVGAVEPTTQRLSAQEADWGKSIGIWSWGTVCLEHTPVHERQGRYEPGEYLYNDFTVIKSNLSTTCVQILFKIQQFF